MVRAEEITLITEQPHGVFVTTSGTSKRVPCSIRSVTRNEAYQAKANNLNPEFVFVMDHYFDYDGQEFCQYNNNRYHIIRTYVSGETIELVVERVI